MENQTGKKSGGFNPIGLCIGLGIGLCFCVALGHRKDADDKMDDSSGEDKK